MEQKLLWIQKKFQKKFSMIAYAHFFENNVKIKSLSVLKFLAFSVGLGNSWKLVYMNSSIRRIHF